MLADANIKSFSTLQQALNEIQSQSDITEIGVAVNVVNQGELISIGKTTL